MSDKASCSSNTNSTMSSSRIGSLPCKHRLVESSTTSSSTEEAEAREKCFGSFEIPQKIKSHKGLMDTLPENESLLIPDLLNNQKKVAKILALLPKLLCPIHSKVEEEKKDSDYTEEYLSATIMKKNLLALHHLRNNSSVTKSIKSSILDETCHIGPYILKKSLGRGNFAVVKLAQHVNIKADVSIKIMNKAMLGDENHHKIKREIEALKMCQHPNICQLFHIMETENNIYIVMEYAKKGELFDYIIENHAFNEKDARELFWQIVCAVGYCHQLGIAHRDLKAENLLLDHNMNIKVADFGFCNFFQPDEKLTTHCGSPQYAAPELFKGEPYNGPLADVWSLGVIIYILVCGSFPFPGDSLTNIRSQVLKGFIRFPFYLSRSCEELIRSMLQVDVTKRSSLEAVRKNEWMQSSKNIKEHEQLFKKYSDQASELGFNRVFERQHPDHSEIVIDKNLKVEEKKIDLGILKVVSCLLEVNEEKVKDSVMKKRFDFLYSAYKQLQSKLEYFHSDETLRNRVFEIIRERVYSKEESVDISWNSKQFKHSTDFTIAMVVAEMSESDSSPKEVIDKDLNREHNRSIRRHTVQLNFQNEAYKQFQNCFEKNAENSNTIRAPNVSPHSRRISRQITEPNEANGLSQTFDFKESILWTDEKFSQFSKSINSRNKFILKGESLDYYPVRNFSIDSQSNDIEGTQEEINLDSKMEVLTKEEMVKDMNTTEVESEFLTESAINIELILNETVTSTQQCSINCKKLLKMLSTADPSNGMRNPFYDPNFLAPPDMTNADTTRLPRRSSDGAADFQSLHKPTNILGGSYPEQYNHKYSKVNKTFIMDKPQHPGAVEEGYIRPRIFCDQQNSGLDQNISFSETPPGVFNYRFGPALPAGYIGPQEASIRDNKYNNFRRREMNEELYSFINTTNAQVSSHKEKRFSLPNQNMNNEEFEKAICTCDKSYQLSNLFDPNRSDCLTSIIQLQYLASCGIISKDVLSMLGISQLSTVPREVQRTFSLNENDKILDVIHERRGSESSQLNQWNKTLQKYPNLLGSQIRTRMEDSQPELPSMTTNSDSNIEIIKMPIIQKNCESSPNPEAPYSIRMTELRDELYKLDHETHFENADYSSNLIRTKSYTKLNKCSSCHSKIPFSHFISSDNIKEIGANILPCYGKSNSDTIFGRSFKKYGLLNNLLSHNSSKKSLSREKSLARFKWKNKSCFKKKKKIAFEGVHMQVKQALSNPESSVKLSVRNSLDNIYSSDFKTEDDQTADKDSSANKHQIFSNFKTVFQDNIIKSPKRKIIEEFLPKISEISKKATSYAMKAISPKYSIPSSCNYSQEPFSPIENEMDFQESYTQDDLDVYESEQYDTVDDLFINKIDYYDSTQQNRDSITGKILDGHFDNDLSFHKRKSNFVEYNVLNDFDMENATCHSVQQSLLSRTYLPMLSSNEDEADLLEIQRVNKKVALSQFLYEHMQQTCLDNKDLRDIFLDEKMPNSD